MKLKKIDKTYNMYQMELSYGELVAIENSLSSGRSGPLADELFGSIKWHLDDDARLPKPGQEKEDVKEKEEEEAELPLPSPDEEVLPPEGMEEPGEPEGMGMGGTETEEPAPLPPEGEALGGEDIDKMLPPPEE